MNFNFQFVFFNNARISLIIFKPRLKITISNFLRLIKSPTGLAKFRTEINSKRSRTFGEGLLCR